MKLTQNQIERLSDLLERGEITADEANIEKVKMSRVQIIKGSLPLGVRKALNTAVKKGDLCHIKKSGKKPEAYYHPDFEYLMKGERAKCEREILKALSGVIETH